MKGKVMTYLLAFALLIVIANVIAANEVNYNRVVVVSNNRIKTDFAQYGLVEDRYDHKRIVEFGSEIEKQFVQSLDNSLLLLFDEQTKSEAYNKTFSSQAVTNSLMALLERGGMIYFGPTSWDILAHLPRAMRNFFNDIGASLLAASNYKGETPEYYYTAIANQEIKHKLLSEPNDLSKGKWKSPARAVRHWTDFSWAFEPLLIDKDKPQCTIALLEEGVLGKGKILWNLGYTTTRSSQDEFIENILTYIYGPRKALSAKEAMQTRLGGQLTAEVSKNETMQNGFFPQFTNEKLDMSKKIDGVWRNAPQVELKDYKTGELPKKNTVVRSLYDNEFLYILFECEEPEPGKLKTIYTERDQMLWNDDCIEVLLSATKRGTPFAHFIVTPTGVKYDSFDRVSSWDPDYEVTAWTETKNWFVKLKIPFAIFETTPEENQIWKANFCREEKGYGELTSWQKAENGFQDPTSFGDIVFTSKEAYEKQQSIIEPKVSLTSASYLIWKESPWKTSFADSIPEELNDDLKSLQVKVCQNQKTCAKIMVTNFSEVPLTFRIEPSVIQGVENKYSFDDLFTLKEVIPRRNSYKQRQMDPLCRLNEGNIILIPAFETRALWVDVKGQLSPGNYHSKIELIPVDNDKPLKSVKLSVEIVGFEFPDSLPVNTYLWGPYSMTWASGKDDAYYGVAAEYHLKYLYAGFPLAAVQAGTNGPFIDKERDLYVTERIKSAQKHGKIMFSYGIYPEFVSKLKATGFKGVPLDEQWQRLFSEWASTWFGYLEEAGLSFDDFMIQLIDEPRTEDIENIYQCAELLKQIAPDVKIMTDPATWTLFEDIKRLDPVIDFWVPWEPRLTSRPTSEEELNFYQRSGKPFAPYLCATSNDVQPLLNYYRFRGIRSWLFGASGIFMWAYNSWRGNSWDQWDLVEGSLGSKDEAIFYHGDYGPIPSVRAEAFREGIEDFYLLKVAEEKLKAGTLPAEAAKLISENYLTNLMNMNDPDEVQSWRDTLISFL